MKRKDWPSGPEGVRPAGKPDRCFYCGALLGEQHKHDCVIRDQTVVVKMVAELVIVRPESWSPSDIEFHLNDSSWCASNIIHELGERYDNDERCLCPFVEFTYVREATAEDEEAHGLRVADQPS